MPPERCDPVCQADEPGSIVRIGAPDSVVANGKAKVGTLGFDAHKDFRRLRVLGRVRKCFHDDVIRGHFSGLGQPSVDRDIEFDGHGLAAGHRLECWAKSSLRQDRRMDAA
jgi:hypothetical protein